jgi:hypothetical protein
MHKKLGADIMAFLAGSKPAEAEPAKEKKEGKTTTKTTTTTTTTTIPGMDNSKHEVKESTTGTKRKGGGTIIKQ